MDIALLVDEIKRKKSFLCIGLDVDLKKIAVSFFILDVNKSQFRSMPLNFSCILFCF